jgi:hypothetical protein
VSHEPVARTSPWGSVDSDRLSNRRPQTIAPKYEVGRPASPLIVKDHRATFCIRRLFDSCNGRRHLFHTDVVGGFPKGTHEFGTSNAESTAGRQVRTHLVASVHIEVTNAMKLLTTRVDAFAGESLDRLRHQAFTARLVSITSAPLENGDGVSATCRTYG